MRVILCVLSFISISAAQADSTWGKSLWYEFQDGKASLLITGDPAEEIFASLNVKATRIQADVDFDALRKSGKDVSCYQRLDTNEVQCVISVADFRSGSIRKD